MTSKQLLSIVAIIVLASTVFLITSTAASDPSLKLPTTSVILVATNGTQAFFDITLSNVGSGFDVSNGAYLGWCIDIRTELEFSVEHHVTLHSSLDPDVLADQNWTKVNYILNHKQGDAEDIQHAIWYFINLDDGYAPNDWETTSWAIINDTLDNGADFVPTTGEKVAVIAMPDDSFPGAEDVQISIIEVTMPSSEAEPTPTPPGTTPTPAPTSEPGSSPTPTPSQEPGQTTPTPDGSEDSGGTIGNDALMVFGIILALVAIVIVVVLILRRRK